MIKLSNIENPIISIFIPRKRIIYMIILILILGMGDIYISDIILQRIKSKISIYLYKKNLQSGIGI